MKRHRTRSPKAPGRPKSTSSRTGVAHDRHRPPDIATIQRATLPGVVRDFDIEGEGVYGYLGGLTAPRGAQVRILGEGVE